MLTDEQVIKLYSLSAMVDSPFTQLSYKRACVEHWAQLDNWTDEQREYLETVPTPTPIGRDIGDLTKEEAAWIVGNGYTNISGVAVHVENIEIRNGMLCIEWWALNFDRSEYYLPLADCVMPHKFADYLRSIGINIPNKFTPPPVSEVSWEEVKKEAQAYAAEKGNHIDFYYYYIQYFESNYTLKKK